MLAVGEARCCLANGDGLGHATLVNITSGARSCHVRWLNKQRLNHDIASKKKYLICVQYVEDIPSTGTQVTGVITLRSWTGSAFNCSRDMYDSVGSFMSAFVTSSSVTLGCGCACCCGLSRAPGPAAPAGLTPGPPW
jgi:hypothetical protein